MKHFFRGNFEGNLFYFKNWKFQNRQVKLTYLPEEKAFA